jgi:hypothetical protein
MAETESSFLERLENRFARAKITDEWHSPIGIFKHSIAIYTLFDRVKTDLELFPISKLPDNDKKALANINPSRIVEYWQEFESTENAGRVHSVSSHIHDPYMQIKNMAQFLRHFSRVEKWTEARRLAGYPIEKGHELDQLDILKIRTLLSQLKQEGFK